MGTDFLITDARTVWSGPCQPRVSLRLCRNRDTFRIEYVLSTAMGIRATKMIFRGCSIAPPRDPRDLDDALRALQEHSISGYAVKTIKDNLTADLDQIFRGGLVLAGFDGEVTG